MSSQNKKEALKYEVDLMEKEIITKLGKDDKKPGKHILGFYSHVAKRVKLVNLSI